CRARARGCAAWPAWGRAGRRRDTSGQARFAGQRCRTPRQAGHARSARASVGWPEGFRGYAAAAARAAAAWRAVARWAGADEGWRQVARSLVTWALLRTSESSDAKGRT